MKCKIVIILAVALIALLSVGCSEKKLPEGYKILCSFEGNKYSLVFPNGRTAATVWNSKKGAIRFAIHWEADKNKPFVSESSKYEWDECNQ